MKRSPARRKRSLTAVSVAVLALVCAASAHAQTTPPQAPADKPAANAQIQNLPRILTMTLEEFGAKDVQGQMITMSQALATMRERITSGLRAPKDDKKIEAASKILADRVDLIVDRMDLAEILKVTDVFRKKQPEVLLWRIIDAYIKTKLDALNKALAEADTKNATPENPAQKP